MRTNSVLTPCKQGAVHFLAMRTPYSRRKLRASMVRYFHVTPIPSVLSRYSISFFNENKLPTHTLLGVSTEFVLRGKAMYRTLLVGVWLREK